MKIEHAAIYVKDLEGAREFFMRYFSGSSNDGYYNRRTGVRSYFITFEDGARLELMNLPDIAEPVDAVNRFGYAHLAFSVGSREAVDELTDRLKQDGYEVISGPRVTGDGYYESSLRGFEGNVIEITV